MNKLGARRVALSAFVTHLGSFAFQASGPGMIWNVYSQTYEEPTTDEKDRTIGFLTCTTIAYNFTERQHHSLLDEAIDLNTLVTE